VECVGRPWDNYASASASASSRSSSSDGLPRRERIVDRNSPVLVPVRIAGSPVWDEKEDSDLDSQRALTPSSSGSRTSTPSLLSTPLTEDTDSSLMVYKRKEYFETPQVFGGSVLTAINALNATPIAQNARNVELYHFCKIFFTVPFLSPD
jgi:hypothetical protein